MNITDAALEINHWCHEKVTYQPSDSRTSAPVSTILSARGRCGEESVLTVAALRTAVFLPVRCIPPDGLTVTIIMPGGSLDKWRMEIYGCL